MRRRIVIGIIITTAAETETGRMKMDITKGITAIIEMRTRRSIAIITIQKGKMEVRILILTTRLPEPKTTPKRRAKRRAKI
jgi:hypothetical protein